ncbi:hypothetical protein [Mycobacteroides abscessus]|nr:hypothetical protein [Mycobacteroides abscessus]
MSDIVARLNNSITRRLTEAAGPGEPPHITATIAVAMNSAAPM